MPRPNVLYIMADQFNANCLGAVQKQVKTPHLDQLAREGIRFNHAYCNSPICGPSRSTFITGQYPRTHGVMGNDLYDVPDRNGDTIPAVFRRMGYQTAMIGKAHLIGEWSREGFEYIRFCDLCDCDLNDPLQNHYFNYLQANGIAHLYDLGSLKPEHAGSGMRAFESTIPDCHSLETWTGNSALEFLQNRDESRPFFMHLSFQRPHEPLTVPFDRGLLYDPGQIELPKGAADWFTFHFASKPEPMRKHAAAGGKYPYVPKDKEDLQRQLAFYFSLITLIDEQIGRVIGWLKQNGLDDNTVIVFTADHGDFAGEHGMVLKNIGLYESIHRIPFILKYPGGVANVQSDEMIESVDLYPSLCELAQVPIPDTVEGKSIVPIMEKASSGKTEVICEWLSPRYDKRVNAIRTRQYRLVHYGYGEEGELYDLHDDPDELHNVYSDPAFINVKLKLLEQILDHIGRHRVKVSPAMDTLTGHHTRNCMTKQLHKGNLGWKEISPLYQ